MNIINKYEFPILYKKNNKIRFWKIYINEYKNNIAKIYSEYGLIDGKIIKSNPQIISKSIGKINSFNRAIKIAKTKWINKKETNK